MLKPFVEIWDKYKGELEEWFQKNHPEDYSTIAKMVVGMIENHTDSWESCPSVKEMSVINKGSYQGALLFVFGSRHYDSEFWAVVVSYGSCSGCDTLENIKSKSKHDEEWNVLPPTPQQVEDYMTLALHIVQKLKPIADDYNL